MIRFSLLFIYCCFSSLAGFCQELPDRDSEEELSLFLVLVTRIDDKVTSWNKNVKAIDYFTDRLLVRSLEGVFLNYPSLGSAEDTVYKIFYPDKTKIVMKKCGVEPVDVKTRIRLMGRKYYTTKKDSVYLFQVYQVSGLWRTCQMPNEYLYLGFIGRDGIVRSLDPKRNTLPYTI